MNIVGLQKGMVELRGHSTAWRELFLQEKGLLLERFAGVILEVSHGGSTAIPGIPAKPIIDMFAAVPNLEVAESLREELGQLGYDYRGEAGIPGRVLYVKGPPENRTRHLHLVEREHDEWKNHILIREYYLKHPEAAEEYANLKRTLAAQYGNDRASYTKGKADFIQSILTKAKLETT